MSTKAYREGYALIRWTPIKPSAPTQTQEQKGKASYFMPDIAEFTSPLNFERITSRSQLREHEKRHGVRQCGELKSAADFDNKRLKPQAPREKALERAYRNALSKVIGD